MIYNDGSMTQDKKWKVKYEEVVHFIETNKRNPSWHRIEEHDMVDWVKANRKVMNAGKLAEPRFSQFVKLLELSNKYKRVNQYQ